MPVPLLLRSHEIMDWKRCPKMWFWKWRMGLVPKERSLGALDLGSWLHDSLAPWYKMDPSARTVATLMERYRRVVRSSVQENIPSHVLEKGRELAKLGQEMLKAYARHYQGDKDWDVIGAEIPLEVEITDQDGRTLGVYRMKLDLAVRERSTGKIWIVEHKSAKVIRTEHLSIDGQARPYGSLAEIAMKRSGILGKRESIEGILYNFLRKALPDPREVNAEGLALNKDGSISKKQQAPLFKRHPVKLTKRAKLVALKRIQRDVTLLTELRSYLAKHREFADKLPKTPHHSCPKFCDFFAMCELEEEGGAIGELQRGTFVRRDPYEYETTDETFGFEIG